jgi:hypothetical protein
VPLPHSIEWSDLSPASLETVTHVALRMSAGFDLPEIAAMCERESFRHSPLPTKGRTITKAWCSVRMGELREEIRATAATD